VRGRKYFAAGFIVNQVFIHAARGPTCHVARVLSVAATAFAMLLTLNFQFWSTNLTMLSPFAVETELCTTALSASRLSFPCEFNVLKSSGRIIRTLSL